VLEHLDRKESLLFLKEAKRVLRSGGIIRLVVPDIRICVQKYIENNDADAFIGSLLMSQPRPRTLQDRIRILLVGTRHHQWMYDGPSLSRLLQTQGFASPQILRAGESQISDPQGLDLLERSSESTYVEARNP
jgi:predicted SAM-dependent methyltransferase